MTKKDYELIARALKQSYDNASTLVVVEKNTKKPKSEAPLLRGIAFTVLTMTAHLERTNARFDRARFLAACGFIEREPDVLVPLEEVSKEAAKNARAFRRGKRYSEPAPGPSGDEGTD